MTAPRIRQVPTSLQRQMARPGGLSVTEALARAEQGLEDQRARTTAILHDHVEALQRLCDVRDLAGVEAVYPLASALVDMSGFLEIPAFYEAAYSLCEASSRMIAADAWSWPSVEVHVRALTLILADDAHAGPGTDDLLAGLRAVVARTPRV